MAECDFDPRWIAGLDGDEILCCGCGHWVRAGERHPVLDEPNEPELPAQRP